MRRRFVLALQTSVIVFLGLAAPGWAFAQEGQDPAASLRLWVEELNTTRTPQAYLEVTVSKQFILPASVLWNGNIVAVEPFDDVTARLTVEDAQGTPKHAGEIVLDIVEGENPFALAWTLDGLEDGVYRATLEIVRAGDFSLATKTYRVRQISTSSLEALLREVEGELRLLDEHLAGFEEAPTSHSAYRLAIVRDYLPTARQAFTDGSWRRAQDDASFLRSLIDSIRVDLTLRTVLDEPMSPPVPKIRSVTVRAGKFNSDGQDVFLFGASGEVDELVAAIPALRRYGLNLLETRVGPADTLPSRNGPDGLPPAISGLFEAAENAEMGVSVNLAPDAMASWAYDAWPALAERRAGTFPYDVTHHKVDSILERHFRSVLSNVAKRSSLVSVALADRPEMQFAGEPIRRGLIAFAKDQYGDRETMNRVWGSFYLDFDEIVMDAGLDRPAFRHDLALYQYELGTAFLARLAEFARQYAPGAPLQINLSDRVFVSGESAFSVDREAIAPIMDVSGCTAVQALNHPYLALGYPSQSLNYTLLRSLNSEAPVFNTWDSFIPAPASPAIALDRAAYALAWEGALAGMSASTAPLGRPDGNPQTLLGRPQRLEGYARACLDLNRLSPVVAAFQDAPPEVSIMWSMSSKIYSDGDPYLESVQRAYEGCHTFGFKVAFVTEDDCARGALEDTSILVIPDVPSMTDEAFTAIDAYIAGGGVTIRQGKPIPYNPRGLARHESLTTSARTLLIRGIDLPTEYLHALDAACEMEGVPSVPRAINASQYPLEGVKTRFVEYNNGAYLYAINLRKEPVTVHLTGPYSSGDDLIGGNEVRFPLTMDPSEPLLLRLHGSQPGGEAGLILDASTPEDTPLGIVEPIRDDVPEAPLKPPVRHQEIKR
jgi:hypothetical protein